MSKQVSARTAPRLSALVAACAFAGNAQAEPLAVECPERGPSSPSVSLVYEGGSKGTLKVRAPFGAFALPATRDVRKDRDGFDVTGIRAFGRATLRMPDQRAMEICVAEKDDAHYCSDVTTDETDEISAAASVNIAIFEPPGATVEIERTYLEPFRVGRNRGIPKSVGF